MNILQRLGSSSEASTQSGRESHSLDPGMHEPSSQRNSSMRHWRGARKDPNSSKLYDNENPILPNLAEIYIVEISLSK